MDPPEKGKMVRSKAPTVSVSVFMVGDAGKAEGLKLSSKTYGPAQCKIGDVWLGGKPQCQPDSFTAGSVFWCPPSTLSLRAPQRQLRTKASPKCAAIH